MLILFVNTHVLKREEFLAFDEIDKTTQAVLWSLWHHGKIGKQLKPSFDLSDTMTPRHAWGKQFKPYFDLSDTTAGQGKTT